ncbi:MAG TPA: TlpA disulfide reductase family protein [Thermoanaerobaculia bacterium]|jgi:thiol-disulfide isomerase/thioredoxin
MNLRRLPLTLLVLACLLAAGSAVAQDTRLQSLQGGEHLADSDMAKGTIIVVFWTSWSPHSRDIVARVNPLARRWSGKARVVTVNFQEERQAVESFLAGKGLTVSVFLDGDGAFAKKYSMATLPGLLIVRDGQTLYKGRLPDDPDRVISEYLG